MTAQAGRLEVVQPERRAGLVVRVSTDRQAQNQEGLAHHPAPAPPRPPHLQTRRRR